MRLTFAILSIGIGIFALAAPARAANAYIDPAACARCHADKAKTYSQTGMGRSFYRMTPETAVEDFKSGLPFHHPASDTYFNVFERGGNYFERRWQIGFDKQENQCGREAN